MIPVRETRHHGSGSRHRPTVRIVRRRIPLPALISLSAVAAVSIVLLVLWLMWRGDPNVDSVLRTLDDVEIAWKCEGGHAFRASAQADKRKCTQCGKDAAATTEFECPTHSPVEVEAKFEKDAQGNLRISKFRVPPGEWVAAGERISCAKCGAALTRKIDDPLERTIKSKRRGG